MSGNIDTNALRSIHKRSLALVTAMDSAKNSSTPDHGKWGSAIMFAEQYTMLAEAYHSYAKVEIPSPYAVPIFDADKFKSSSNYTWISLKEIFDIVYLDVLSLEALLREYETSATSKVLEFEDFLQMNLRKAVFDIPEKETEIQNAIEILFSGKGLKKPGDYDRETGRVKSSGKENVPDFIIKAPLIAIEVKLIRNKGSKSEIIEQMKSDIIGYRPDYKQILFVVYDLGGIQDVAEFVSGFVENPGVRVVVVKH